MLARKLPKDLEDRYESMAQKHGQTKTAFMRQILIDRLEELEDIELAKQALAEDDGTRYSLSDIRTMIAAKAD